jgi:hypothetical protein
MSAPAFHINADDPLAPSLVEAWAATAFYSGRDAQVIGAALDIARKMRAYQKEQGILEVHVMPQYTHEFTRRQGALYGSH